MVSKLSKLPAKTSTTSSPTHLTALAALSLSVLFCAAIAMPVGIASASPSATDASPTAQPAQPLSAQGSDGLTGAISPSLEVQGTSAGSTQDMYRLYNATSGEHFFTGSASERDHLSSIGWLYEGVGWVAPQSSSVPVYRLYNPYAGDHHYTTSSAERSNLIRVGWRDEGVGWYSDEQKRVGLLRAYNPNAIAGAHHFTTDQSEINHICGVGWRNEGLGWYGVAAGRSVSVVPNAMQLQMILNNVSGSGGISTFCGDISASSRARINTLLARGSNMSCVAISAKTGKCVARSADMRMFSASTIKAAYVAALCKYNAPGIVGWRSRLYNIITFSSNEDYNALYNQYGKWWLERFAAESGVSLDLKYATLYADITPRELAKLWVSIRSYIISNEANVSLFRSTFGNGAYYKEGWMTAGMWCGQMYHIAGIQGDVIYAIMTRDSQSNGNVWELKSALVQALS